jgi:hypothetical protein
MDYTKFTEAYKQVITESNDSELRNYIRSVVEEVIKEMNGDGIDEEELEEAPSNDDARKDFKNNVMPIFKDIKDNGKINQEFKDAVEAHIKQYGDYQVWNFFGSEDGEMPHWYNSKSKTVKLGASKFVPKENFD